MPTLRVVTPVAAPRARVFDLARSIDLHRLSTAGTEEEAIAGRTTGLIGYGEEVTWRARHFGVRQTLTARVTGFNRPFHFTDEMVTGAFASFTHLHAFEEAPRGTVMVDTFTYTAPLGPLGPLVERLVLNRYLTKLLTERNAVIKAYAESDRWREVPGLGGPDAGPGGERGGVR